MPKSAAGLKSSLDSRWRVAESVTFFLFLSSGENEEKKLHQEAT